MTALQHTHLAFAGHTCIARGALPEVARAVRLALDAGESRPVAVFESAASAPVDLDLRGTPDEAAARAAAMAGARARGTAGADLPGTAGGGAAGAERKGPGRPKLGVVGREVTLLPRQWDWLAAQPGGASVTLRKLVEGARKADQESNRTRRTQDVAYRFMHALAGNLPDFEEATRALYRWDLPRLEGLIEPWPVDVRDHILRIVREEN